ncbi:hypothetical protein L484_011203 [Morus notabilis]|uniref:Uncharacterized protein n=1 Tax=Morus notabilis TaxID=981085 RepID=W9SAJ7_9ROSA|nr:hypothetical protein L484_011203 [Morus notabilis]
MAAEPIAAHAYRKEKPVKENLTIIRSMKLVASYQQFDTRRAEDNREAAKERVPDDCGGYCEHTIQPLTTFEICAASTLFTLNSSISYTIKFDSHPQAGSVKPIAVPGLLHDKKT